MRPDDPATNTADITVVCSDRGRHKPRKIAMAGWVRAQGRAPQASHDQRGTPIEIECYSCSRHLQVRHETWETIMRNLPPGVSRIDISYLPF